jgi:hypothetical protein
MHFYVLELGQAITTMADKLGFSSWQEQETSSLRAVQTDSWDHPASYPMGSRKSLARLKWSEREIVHNFHVVNNS